MIAHPQIFISRTMDFFRRNNPLIIFAFSIVQGIYFMVTWPSRIKIMKYKLMLEVERLEKMQQTLALDPVYQNQVGKMNRVY